MLKPFIRNLKYYKATAIRKLFPYKCPSCGNKVYFRSPEYDGVVAGKRLTVKAVAADYTCRDCVANALECNWYMYACAQRKENIGYTVNLCDCCGKPRDNTVRHVIMKAGLVKQLHFCLLWWNDFNICERCALEVVRKGYAKSGIGVYINNVHYEFNGHEIVTKGQQLK